MAWATAVIARSIPRSVAATVLWLLSCQSFVSGRRNSMHLTRSRMCRCVADSNRSSSLWVFIEISRKEKDEKKFSDLTRDEAEFMSYASLKRRHCHLASTETSLQLCCGWDTFRRSFFEPWVGLKLIKSESRRRLTSAAFACFTMYRRNVFFVFGQPFVHVVAKRPYELDIRWIVVAEWKRSALLQRKLKFENALNRFGTGNSPETFWSRIDTSSPRTNYRSCISGRVSSLRIELHRLYDFYKLLRGSWPDIPWQWCCCKYLKGNLEDGNLKFASEIQFWMEEK